MLYQNINQYQPAPSKEGVPSFEDHLLLHSQESNVSVPLHYTGLGIISALEGNASMILNEMKVSIKKDEFFVINRGSLFSLNRLGPQSSLVILFFNSTLSELLSQSIFNQNLELGNADFKIGDFSLIEHIHYQNASLKEHFILLLQLGNSCASFGALKADMIIRSILDAIIEENYQAIQTSSHLKVVKQSTKIDLYKRLSLAKQWMTDHYDTSFNQNEVAEIAMLNAQHFLRLFKQAFRLTPHQYVTKLRISRACELLVSTNKSVAEICGMVGFDSQASFTHLFKQHMGLSPGAYRKQEAP